MLQNIPSQSDSGADGKPDSDGRSADDVSKNTVGKKIGRSFREREIMEQLNSHQAEYQSSVCDDGFFSNTKMQTLETKSNDMEPVLNHTVHSFAVENQNTDSGIHMEEGLLSLVQGKSITHEGDLLFHRKRSDDSIVSLEPVCRKYKYSVQKPLATKFTESSTYDQNKMLDEEELFGEKRPESLSSLSNQKSFVEKTRRVMINENSPYNQDSVTAKDKLPKTNISKRTSFDTGNILNELRSFDDRSSGSRFESRCSSNSDHIVDKKKLFVEKSTKTRSSEHALRYLNQKWDEEMSHNEQSSKTRFSERSFRNQEDIIDKEKSCDERYSRTRFSEHSPSFRGQLSNEKEFTNVRSTKQEFSKRTSRYEDCTSNEPKRISKKNHEITTKSKNPVFNQKDSTSKKKRSPKSKNLFPSPESIFSEEDFDLVDSTSDISKQKRGRTVIVGKKLNALLSIFERNPFPNSMMREEIAFSLGIKPRTVQIWFQNQRQKVKMQLKSDGLYIGQLSMYRSSKNGEFAMLDLLSDAADIAYHQNDVFERIIKRK